MACFSCGETFNSDVRFQLAKYKREFEQHGIKRVYYKLGVNEPVLISRADEFFKTIKPKHFTKKTIKSGAEFAFIQEFGPSTNTDILEDNKNQ